MCRVSYKLTLVTKAQDVLQYQLYLHAQKTAVTSVGTYKGLGNTLAVLHRLRAGFHISRSPYQMSDLEEHSAW